MQSSTRTQIQYDPSTLRFSGEKAYDIEEEFVTTHINRVSGSEEILKQPCGCMMSSAQLAGIANSMIGKPFFIVNRATKERCLPSPR